MSCLQLAVFSIDSLATSALMSPLKLTACSIFGHCCTNQFEVGLLTLAAHGMTTNIIGKQNSGLRALAHAACLILGKAPSMHTITLCFHASLRMWHSAEIVSAFKTLLWVGSGRALAVACGKPALNMLASSGRISWLSLGISAGLQRRG